MKKNVLHTLLTIIVPILAHPFALSAQTTTWTGATDNDFNTAGNWDNGLPGDPSPTPIISADGANVTMSGAVSTRTTVISGNGTTAPKLTITENYTNLFSVFQVGSNATGNNYSGIVEHTSGTLAISGGSGARRLQIAVGADGTTTGHSGLYTFGGASSTAPTVDVAGNVYIGQRPGESGTLTLQDHGTFTSAEKVSLAEFNGSATLNVIGGDLTIDLATGVIAGADGLAFAKSGGGTATLNATITSTGLSTINVGGDVQFDNGGGGLNTLFNLFLDGVTPSAGTTYNVIVATGSFTGNGVFGNVGDGDIITVDGIDFEADYTGGTFSITAIPEPSQAVALFGLVAFASIFLRRSRAA